MNISTRSNTVTGFRVQVRFFLDQKYAGLQGIRDLFGYGLVIERKIDMYRYYSTSFIGLSPISQYFASFPLKSKKVKSFANWLTVYKMVINKEHLTDDGLVAVRQIKRTININNAQCTKTGSANP